MKIAITTNSSWAAYNFRLNLAKTFIENGHEVVFIIPFDDKYSLKLKKNFKCYNLFINPKSINPLKDLVTFFHLLLIYWRVRPDIACHFSIKINIYGSIAARIKKISSLSNITGLGTLFIKKNIVTRISKLLYRISLFFAYRIFFQNPHDLNYFVENNLVKKSKSKLLPGSGVDLKKFQFKLPSPGNKKFVFLVIARLIRDKGIYEYIKAIEIIKKRYPDKMIEFQLLGESNSINQTAISTIELEDWINKGLINYLGVSDQVENFISKCHCVVLPSYREGMPRSILEALAIGRPVVVSDVPGCIDIVDHKTNGLICKVKSSKDLARKMISIMRISQDTRDYLAMNGRKKIENFYDEKIVLNEYISSIDNIAKYEKAI
jgi:glycosyltransferase involved in cell wall biosynthesis